MKKQNDTPPDLYAVASPEKEGDGAVIDGGISLDRDSQLERGLKSRHIQFLALGGA